MEKNRFYAGCMQESRQSVRFCRYKNISQLPLFLFQQNQLVHHGGFSDFTFKSMFCSPGHSTRDGREMGTGKRGRSIKNCCCTPKVENTGWNDATAYFNRKTRSVTHAQTHNRLYLCIRCFVREIQSIRELRSIL